MMKIIFFVVSLAALATLADARIYNTINGSLSLNDTSLDFARSDWRYLVVDFDKGCKWCHIFRPYFRQARIDLKAENAGVAFGWMNLKNNPITEAKYKIVNHPTQLLFIRNYPKSPIRYTGTKNTNSLKAWIKQKLVEVKALGY